MYYGLLWYMLWCIPWYIPWCIPWYMLLYIPWYMPWYIPWFMFRAYVSGFGSGREPAFAVRAEVTAYRTTYYTRIGIHV